MIVLPTYPPRRAWLTSFGLVVGSLLALTGIVGGALVPGPGAAGALAAGALLAALSWYYPQALAVPYRVWNGVAYRLAVLTRAWVVWIMFHVVLTAVGLLGRERSALMLDRRPASMWEPRVKSAAGFRGRPPTVCRIPARKNFRFQLFFSWIRESGNWWALSLAPFLFLVSQLEEERPDGKIQENVYTLF